MWQQYKKRFLITQTFIWSVCAIGLWVMHMHPFVLMMMFAMMQLGAIMGAWWSARLMRAMEAAREKLPLEK